MSECPCGAEKEFQSCCEKYINGSDKPETAEKLLRSRYTAFTKKNIEYIFDTLHPKKRKKSDMDANREWAESVTWNGLDVIGIDGGGPKDQEAHIEFKAFFTDDEGEQEHHELSEFRKLAGKWYFYEAQYFDDQTNVREEPKVGRNDACPCGSEKKYKKCCGAN